MPFLFFILSIIFVVIYIGSEILAALDFFKSTGQSYSTSKNKSKKSSSNSKTKSRKKSRRSKDKLTETYKKTLEYLKQGLSIIEIAEKRDYQISTIESHIKKLRKHNKLKNVTVKRKPEKESIDNVELYEWQKELIEEHLDFYKSLESGDRTPETPEQKHFVKVLQDDADPQTKHEFAYLRYKENNGT